jgi:hypothetical protein
MGWHFRNSSTITSLLRTSSSDSHVLSEYFRQPDDTLFNSCQEVSESVVLLHRSGFPIFPHAGFSRTFNEQLQPIESSLTQLHLADTSSPVPFVFSPVRGQTLRRALFSSWISVASSAWVDSLTIATVPRRSRSARRFQWLGQPSQTH